MNPKIRDILTVAGGFTFFVFFRDFWISPPLSWLPYAALVISICTIPSVFKKRDLGPVVARLGKLYWPLDIFCRGWSITGSTGSGKTASALRWLAHQLFQNVPNWGGIIVDPKCVLWIDFQEIAKTYGRQDDFINLQVRPPDAPKNWKPKHRFNILSYPGLPWSTKAKIVMDTVSSLTGGDDKGFFKQQAQIHIQKGMEALASAGQSVTLTRLYEILSSEETMLSLIEALKEKSKAELLPILKERPEAYEKARQALIDLQMRALQEAGDGDVPDMSAVETEVSDDYFSVELILEHLPPETPRPAPWELAIHFSKNWIDVSRKAGEQFEGVRNTILNNLFYFTDPDIAEVFCADENTFEFGDVDKGKFIAVSVPQRYQIERDFIATFLKLLFYVHTLSRFDYKHDKKRWEARNLIVFIADEAQGVATASEDGYADYNVADKIREARGTIIFATQSTTSYLPRLKDEKKVRVLLLNLKNQMYYQLADEPAAKQAAEVIGKHKYWKRSYSYSRGGTQSSSSFQEVEEYWITPNELMRLKNFDVVIKHPQQGFVRTHLPPLDDQGKVSERYLQELYQ